MFHFHCLGGDVCVVNGGVQESGFSRNGWWAQLCILHAYRTAHSSIARHQDSWNSSKNHCLIGKDRKWLSGKVSLVLLSCNFLPSQLFHSRYQGVAPFIHGRVGTAMWYGLGCNFALGALSLWVWRTRFRYSTLLIGVCGTRVIRLQYFPDDNLAHHLSYPCVLSCYLRE